jgi:site-specific DNA-cytosine methylase
VWYVKSKRAQSVDDDETWLEGGVVPTLNAFDSGDSRATVAVLSSSVRRLTPVECERLQGFPDDWTAGQADSHRYKQMGNAVTTNVVNYVACLINMALEGDNERSEQG